MQKLFATLVFFWLGSALSAAPITYFCELSSHSRGGWIPETAAYAIETNSRTIVVHDRFIQHANKKALQARILEFGPAVYRFSWSVKLPLKGNKARNIGYTARLDTRNNKVSIKAFVGDDGSHRGSGKCKVIKR